MPDSDRLHNHTLILSEASCATRSSRSDVANEIRAELPLEDPPHDDPECMCEPCVAYYREIMADEVG